MENIARERAFKQDLFLNEIWSDRFFDLVEKKLSTSDAKTLLYLNAGTGRNCFRIAEVFGKDKQIIGVCDTPEHLAIARDKAKALASDISFVTEIEVGRKYDLVIADATLSNPQSIADLLSTAVAALDHGGEFVMIVPVSGSFAEVFSILWEVLAANNDSRSALVERLISMLPTLDTLENAANQAGLEEIAAEVSTELFEYEKPEDFTESPLFADFLLPDWFTDMDKSELEATRQKMAKLIEQEHGNLPFRFQVKAALLTGKRV